MALQAISLPLLPGMSDAWWQFADELQTTRAAQHQAALVRHGGTKSPRGYVQFRAYLQPWQAGHVAMYAVKGGPKALRELFGRFGRSADPHDRWFSDSMLRLHGIDIGAADSLPQSSLVYKLRWSFGLKRAG